jgi:hypothetical protein
MQLTGTRKALKRRIDALRSGTTKTRGADDARLKQALCDPFCWATEYTQTYNEHWAEEERPSPYEPFPRRLPYFKPLFEVFELERIIWIVKSRDMMISWACVAYLTWKAMTTPLCGSVVQTQKEKKVIQLVEYAKCLYRCQPAWLRDEIPLAKALKNQSELELQFANGSYIVGIPGGADQIRSYQIPFAVKSSSSCLKSCTRKSWGETAGSNQISARRFSQLNAASALAYSS